MHGSSSSWTRCLADAVRMPSFPVTLLCVGLSVADVPTSLKPFDLVRPASALTGSLSASSGDRVLQDLMDGSESARVLSRPPVERLVASSGDKVLQDLMDSSESARVLSLPPAEQRRAEAMQDLEDERLERCRSASAFEFDQCFFFGSDKAVDARRPMEGAGLIGKPSVFGGPREQTDSASAARAKDSNRIPTW